MKSARLMWFFGAAVLTACLVAACFGDIEVPSASPDAGPPDVATVDSASGDTGVDSGTVSDSGVDADSSIGFDAAAEASTDAAVDAADAGPPGPPPSCALIGAGRTDCGSGESCCTSLLVTGGAFYRTYTDGGTVPKDPATVSSFRLDKYEVTVGRFREFVAAWNGGSGWTPPAGSGKHTHLNGGQGLVNCESAAGNYETGWVATDDSNIAPTAANLDMGTWSVFPVNTESLPITNINWYEAYAFCIWDEGFLPSEAESTYASAGGNLQLIYPWGNTDPGNGNQYAIYGCLYPSGMPNGCPLAADDYIANVGTAALGVGHWGQLDLAGNAFEQTLDYFANYVACNDCAALSPSTDPNGTQRTSKGGDFATPNFVLSAPYRSAAPAESRGFGNGIRCARTP